MDIRYYEYNEKFNSFIRAGDTGRPAPPTFLCSKKKKGWQRKKERVSKQKLLKGCQQGQNVIVLTILERLELENFSCRPTMVADNTFQCSMAPSLWNPFCRPCSWWRSLSYGNQSTDLQSKPMEWFLYYRDLRLERVKSQRSLRKMVWFNHESYNAVWNSKK